VSEGKVVLLVLPAGGDGHNMVYLEIFALKDQVYGLLADEAHVVLSSVQPIFELPPLKRFQSGQKQ